MLTRATQGMVLVADDDDELRRVFARFLTGAGFAVQTVPNGDDAVRAFEGQSFDLVLADIDMPGRNGIELLQAIRERDLDVPVVLVTGAPRLDTAMAAVEHGASRYLTKPVDLAELRDMIRRVMNAGRLARARRSLAVLEGLGSFQIGDLAGLAARFDKALEAVFMVWQPIVRWSNRSVFAYKALVRSGEPTIPKPDALFDAADRLDRVVDIGRRVRAICVDPSDAGDGVLRFVNLHTKDLLDDSLYEAGTPLAKMAPHVVLEITERARLEGVSDLTGRIARLRRMGFRVALDDIGAGYAGLTSFAALEPDFVKLDRALVQGINQSTTKTKLVGSMIRACLDLGVQVVAEGIEISDERDVLIDLGCDVFQGYLFARPATTFAQPSF